MKDDIFRIWIKRAALVRWRIDLFFTRLFKRAAGEPRFCLEGTCNGCGKCCERPMIQTNVFVFRMRGFRALFLFWHRYINGFKYVGEDKKTRAFHFRCTHYLPQSGQCDSYASRPGMCRDYPYNLLFGIRPAFFPECSYSARDKQGRHLSAALEKLNLSAEQREELRRKLYLGDP